MGKIRAFINHTKWTSAEVEVLNKMYPSTASFSAMEFHLPGRHRRMIQCKANALGLSRPTKTPRTPDEIRQAKREHMARRRLANPAEARDRARNWHRKNRAKSRARMRAYAAKRFFWNREMHLRGEGRATARELAAIWKAQKGRCALTGRRLDRTAHLDHIHPIAKGGSHRADNLRWLCHEANLAKRALSDQEFIALCRDCMAWIGRRIATVDAIPS